MDTQPAPHTPARARLRAAAVLAAAVAAAAWAAPAAAASPAALAAGAVGELVAPEALTLTEQEGALSMDAPFLQR
ncbi:MULTISPECIES: hypothetical protein [unclassified Streptomyces]|uniref:hypothetical protein n=1 Tax=unclassified Streptomyces TaxID=2593676 RepID=UPI0033E62CFB